MIRVVYGILILQSLRHISISVKCISYDPYLNISKQADTFLIFLIQGVQQYHGIRKAIETRTYQLLIKFESESNRNVKVLWAFARFGSGNLLIPAVLQREG